MLSLTESLPSAEVKKESTQGEVGGKADDDEKLKLLQQTNAMLTEELTALNTAALSAAFSKADDDEKLEVLQQTNSMLTNELTALNTELDQRESTISGLCAHLYLTAIFVYPHCVVLNASHRQCAGCSLSPCPCHCAVSISLSLSLSLYLSLFLSLSVTLSLSLTLCSLTQCAPSHSLSLSITLYQILSLTC